MMLPCQCQSLQAKAARDADCVTYRSLRDAITCKLVTFFGVERGSVESSDRGKLVEVRPSR